LKYFESWPTTVKVTQTGVFIQTFEFIVTIEKTSSEANILFIHRISNYITHNNSNATLAIILKDIIDKCICEV
jgi:hypothetical protein